MTPSNIQQDIDQVQNALKGLHFEDQSTLENAPNDLQTLLHRVVDEYKITLTSKHSLKDALEEIQVELEIEASYESKCRYRP